jgi:hypothetical protein
MTGPVAPTVAQPLLRPYRMGDFPLANRDRRRLEDETRSGTSRIAHRLRRPTGRGGRIDRETLAA